MVKCFSSIPFFVVMLFSSPTLAHHAGTPIVGIVTALYAGHVVIKTDDGKLISILLNSGTKYRRDTATATNAALKLDTRIVVRALEGGETLIASEICLCASSKDKARRGRDLVFPSRNGVAEGTGRYRDSHKLAVLFR